MSEELLKMYAAAWIHLIGFFRECDSVQTWNERMDLIDGKIEELILLFGDPTKQIPQGGINAKK